MNCKLPNLELLEYKAKVSLLNDEEFMKKFNDIKSKRGFAYVDFDTTTFSQIWGSTCTGFDVAKDGSPAIGGCAMTKEYTTVVHELLTDTYIVFFGDKGAYVVTDANERFLSDLKNHSIASLSVGKEVY